MLLERARFNTSTCEEIIKGVADEEQIALQRSRGRIESRKRFKRSSSQPLLDHRPVNYLYLDESGQSGGDPGPQGFFALGAISINQEDVDNYVVAADQLKRDFFDRADVTFHEPGMRRREGRWGFNGDIKRQAEFDRRLDELVRSTKFIAFGAGIIKGPFVEDYVKTPVDPYLPTDVYAVSIMMLLERYLDYLAHVPEARMGRLTLESIGPREDAMHQLEYARLLLEGTQWVPDSAFRNFLETGLLFTPKTASHPLELADMFSRDIFEWIRSGCTSTPKRWEIFGEKIYHRNDGSMGKFGLKVFPDSDIRSCIEAHRIHCGAMPEDKT